VPADDGPIVALTWTGYRWRVACSCGFEEFTAVDTFAIAIAEDHGSRCPG